MTALDDRPTTTATSKAAHGFHPLRRRQEVRDARAAAGPAPVGSRRIKLLGTLVLAAGMLLGASGAATWGVVQVNLGDERITVAEDASWFAGDKVDGPLTAFSQAQIIEKHALESSGGKTYAELDRKDPTRATVMNGSFLRASLFTSVVSFGVAALAMGLGVLFVLIGLALRSIAATVRDA